MCTMTMREFISYPDTSQMLLTFQPKSLHPLFPWNNSSRTPLSAFKRKKNAKQASNELGRNKIPTKGWLTIFFTPPIPPILIQATSILNPLEGVKMKVFLFSLQNTVTYGERVHTAVVSKISDVLQQPTLFEKLIYESWYEKNKTNFIVYQKNTLP